MASAFRIVEANDARSFLELSREWLVSQLPRSNLYLGITTSARDMPHLYHPRPYFAVVYRRDLVVGTVSMTPPHACLVYLEPELELAADTDTQCELAIDMAERLVAYHRARGSTTDSTEPERRLSNIASSPRFTTILTAVLARVLQPDWSRPAADGHGAAAALGLELNEHQAAVPDRRWAVHLRLRMLYITSRANACRAPAGVGVLEMPSGERVAAGRLRKASFEHFDTLVEWMVDFGLETRNRSPKDVADREPLRAKDRNQVASMLDAGRVFVWELPDGTIVCMAAVSRPIDNYSISISAVFTAAEHRGKGYAYNAVAHLTKRMLADAEDTEADPTTAADEQQHSWTVHDQAADRKYHFVMIHTNADHPTPNAVYERVGFREVVKNLETELLKE